MARISQGRCGASGRSDRSKKEHPRHARPRRWDGLSCIASRRDRVRTDDLTCCRVSLTAVEGPPCGRPVAVPPTPFSSRPSARLEPSFVNLFARRSIDPTACDRA